MTSVFSWQNVSLCPTSFCTPRKKRVEVREIAQDSQEVGFRRKTVNSEQKMKWERSRIRRILARDQNWIHAMVKSVERVKSRGEESFGE